jgi:hypothetical protein
LKTLAFGILAFANLSGPEEQVNWDVHDPQRPMMVAVAPSEAPRIEAAASACGMRRLQRVVRSELAWIIMRDVLARDSDRSQAVHCLARWATAHPNVRAYFFGRMQHSTSD